MARRTKNQEKKCLPNCETVPLCAFHSGDQKILEKYLLKHIKTTGFAEAQDIFHAKHVLTCDRLHHGIRSVFGDRKRKVIVDDDDDYDEWQESEEQSNEELV